MALSSSSSTGRTHDRPAQTPSALVTWLLFGLVFAAVYAGSLFSPPLLDDVDASHAQAAQHILDSGNWVTCYINGIRYIEKPPLPYWAVAVAFKLFGENTFATHLPNALAMLGLAWLSWAWARRAWGPRAGLYAGLAVLTAVGPFLYTRFIIPESYLAFFLLLALYGLIAGFELDRPNWFYWSYAGVALAALTKGLIAPVFFIGAAVPYLILTGQWRRWRRLKLVTGTLLFLAIAAPWHIHPTIGNVHGFFYFYFVNEHLLRFFSLRYPHDYNKLPGVLYWLLHFVWLFPWSLFLPALFAIAWKTRHHWVQHVRHDAGKTVDFYIDHAAREDVGTHIVRLKFRVRTVWLLTIFSAWTLFFFSLSSNQEYYTFPVWAPLLILIAAVIAGIEERRGLDGSEDSLADGWSGSLRRRGRSCGAGAGMGLVDLAQPPVRARYRHAAGTSRRRRLHAVDVAPVRSDRTFVCRAQAAGWPGSSSSAHWPSGGFAAAPQRQAPGRHPEHCRDGCGLPGPTPS
jgi:4-amino-4-deoxy-L-arabinose transferase-like glycosyltransferase